MSRSGVAQKVDRRDFIKGAAAAAGGLAFADWALTNVDAVAQDGQQYVIVSDVLRGGGGAPLGPGCVESSVFKAGEEVVWRAVVFNARTGELINTPDGVTANTLKMNVLLQGQEKAFEMEHRIHPRNAQNPADQIYYWSESWIVPPDVTGKFKYTVSVEGKDGKGTLEVLGTPGVDTFPSALSFNE